MIFGCYDHDYCSHHHHSSVVSVRAEERLTAVLFRPLAITPGSVAPDTPPGGMDEQRDKLRRENERLKEVNESLRRKREEEKQKAVNSYETSAQSYHMLQQNCKMLKGTNQRLAAEVGRAGGRVSLVAGPRRRSCRSRGTCVRHSSLSLARRARTPGRPRSVPLAISPLSTWWLPLLRRSLVVSVVCYSPRASSAARHYP